MTDHHNKEGAFWAESLSVWAGFTVRDFDKSDYASVLQNLTIMEASIKYLRSHAEALELTNILKNEAA